MGDTAASAVARIDTGQVVQAARPSLARGDTRGDERRLSAARGAERVAASTPVELPEHQATDLSFQVDRQAQRILVEVIDRETKSVVRSFPLLLPGSGVPDDQATPRGALVDAKA